MNNKLVGPVLITLFMMLLAPSLHTSPTISSCLTVPTDAYGGLGVDHRDIGEGNEVDFSFVIIADIHADGPRLTNAVNWINDNYDAEKIRFVVLLGDICSYGGENHGNTLIPVLSGLDVPYLPVIGNHDVFADGYPNGVKDYFYRAFSGIISTALDNFPSYHGIDPEDNSNYGFGIVGSGGRWHFICIDSCSKGGSQAPLGGGSDDFLAWLKNEISRYSSPQDHVVILSHHPPTPENFDSWDMPAIAYGLDQFRGDIGYWFAGHSHIAWPINLKWGLHNICPGWVCENMAGTSLGRENYITKVHVMYKPTGGNGNGGDEDGGDGSVPPGGNPWDDGCPTLYAWNGGDFVEENSILPGSASGDVVDFYKLTNPLVPLMGKYRVRIGEPGTQCTSIDSIKLLVVDHPGNVSCEITTNGQLMYYSGTINPAYCTDNHGNDQLPALLNGTGFKAKPGDFLNVGFVNVLPEGGALRPQPGNKPQWEFNAPCPDVLGSGVIGVISRRKNVSTSVIDLSYLNHGENFSVTVHFPSSCELYGVTFLNPVNTSDVTVTTLLPEWANLSKAYAASPIPVTEKLLDSDLSYAQILPGGNLEVAFESLDPPTTGYVRDFFLVSEGGYERARMHGTQDMLVGSSNSTAIGFTNNGTIFDPSSWFREHAWDTPVIPGTRDKASPAFADLDSDGKIDLLINNAINGSIIGYRNVGTDKNPVWQRCTSWDVPSLGGYEQNPTLVDLDCDGLYDLCVAGTYVEGHSHYVAFFENTGNMTTPVWTRKPGWDIAAPDVEWPCATMADLDHDGDYDLLLGSFLESYCAAWENTGNRTNPIWTRKTAWDLNDLPTMYHKKPAFVDLNADHLADLMVGIGNHTDPTRSGIWAYKNTGNLTNPVWIRWPAWDFPLAGMAWVRPAFTDLDANIPPVATLLSPTETRPLDEVTFDASLSYDYDGRIVRYGWDFGDGTPPIEAAGTTVAHKYALNGTFAVTLTVTDDEGLCDARTENLTVTERYEHDVAIDALVPAKSVVSQGFGLGINTTITNRGLYADTFNVTVYANETVVTSQNITLDAGDSQTMSFTWDTTGVVKGIYVISAFAPVPGAIPIDETGGPSALGSSYISGWVTVTVLGDVNGDGKVDMRDIGYVARRFMCRPGDTFWDPNADINNDGIIDMRDIGTVARHFGDHYP